ncbi:venom allergen 5 2-like [Tribolium madens]|uniref:venom allergen 5 2-like n=1 Tax=Tribolium madens TaxID=41895 RepID=UPI001CF74333|nr:venom allergen 5 2-like [Tribolium madens]
MFRSIIFFAVFLCVNGEGKFDPTKVDYCKLKCNKLKSTGCDCKQRGTRSEILEKMIEFRQLCVDYHNYWRNFLASGNETRGFAKPAANMVVMNYDMELEYLARCWGRGLFNGYHDKCRLMSNGKRAGQNIAGVNVKDPSMNRVKIGIRVAWYDEVKDMQEDIYEKLNSVEKYNIGHFTAMCWWSANRVGCARIYTADTKKEKFIHPIYVTALICNYCTKDLKGVINLINGRMYIQGPACTKCPEGEKYNKCNKNFTSLCGELEPVPTEKEWDFDKAKAPKHKSFPIVIFIGLLVVCLF